MSTAERPVPRTLLAERPNRRPKFATSYGPRANIACGSPNIKYCTSDTRILWHQTRAPNKGSVVRGKKKGAVERACEKVFSGYGKGACERGSSKDEREGGRGE